MPPHHFTVDVEEYFQVLALAPYVARESWDTRECRLEEPLLRLLSLLDDAGARGTFFVLGWIAERRPDLVESIARRGHEVASHGWGHRRIGDLTPVEFRRSVRRSREVLEEITGERVLGFRAPSFSITRGREWALDVLMEEGYQYDSSLFPVRRPGYGYSGGRREPHRIERNGGSILEVPPTTLRRAGVNIPAAGGAYFRLLPYGLCRAALRQAGARGAPGTFYIHPWELDPGQPRFPVSLPVRIRHYGRLGRTEERLRRLLSEFTFRPIRETLTSGVPVS